MHIAFAIALQFLTRLPVKLNHKISPTQLGQSVLFYPIIGLLIGIILAITEQLLPSHTLTLNAMILLSLWVIITGGLHLDGLADCSDAWAGGLGNAERSLKIMKDPAAGPIAVIILILTLLLKASALIHLMPYSNACLILIAAPVLGRLSIIILILTSPYIRKKGLGSDLQQHLPKKIAYTIIVILLLSGFIMIHPLILITALITTALIRHLALKRLHGMTGDVYGASVELVECNVLVSAALLYG